MSVSYTFKGTPAMISPSGGTSVSSSPAEAILTIPITEELTAAQLAGVERPVVIALKCTRYENGTSNYTFAYEGEYYNMTSAYAGYDANLHAFRYFWPIYFDVDTNTIPASTSKKIINDNVAFLIFNPTKHENVVVFKKPINIPDPDQSLVDSFNPWRS